SQHATHGNAHHVGNKTVNFADVGYLRVAKAHFSVEHTRHAAKHGITKFKDENKHKNEPPSIAFDEVVERGNDSIGEPSESGGKKPRHLIVKKSSHIFFLLLGG